MDDGYIDVPIDAADPPDTPAIDGDTGTDAGAVTDPFNDSGGSSGDPGIGDIIKDILDDYFGVDQNKEEEEEETARDGEGSTETGEASDPDASPDTPENMEDSGVDPEVLLEMRDMLREHTDCMNRFTATVSGNMVHVSLDSGSTTLLAESVDQQAEILDAMDGMAGLITLVFFVLVFDLLHRFAKRIITNFMGGGKYGTNS